MTMDFSMGGRIPNHMEYITKGLVCCGNEVVLWRWQFFQTKLKLIPRNITLTKAKSLPPKMVGFQARNLRDSRRVQFQGGCFSLKTESLDPQNWIFWGPYFHWRVPRSLGNVKVGPKTGAWIIIIIIETILLVFGISLGDVLRPFRNTTSQTNPKKLSIPM